MDNGLEQEMISLGPNSYPNSDPKKTSRKRGEVALFVQKRINIQHFRGCLSCPKFMEPPILNLEGWFQYLQESPYLKRLQQLAAIQLYQYIDIYSYTYIYVLCYSCIQFYNELYNEFYIFTRSTHSISCGVFNPTQRTNWGSVAKSSPEPRYELVWLFGK